jgi:hypothetical protein
MKIFLSLVFFSYLLFGYEICNKNPDFEATCVASKRYLNILQSNNYKFKKIEAVSSLGAFSTRKGVFSNKGKNHILSKLQKIATYKSSLNDEDFFAIDFEKTEIGIYIVEAYFKDSTRDIIGLNSITIKGKAYIDNYKLIIDGQNIRTINKNNLKFYKEIFPTKIKKIVEKPQKQVSLINNKQRVCLNQNVRLRDEYITSKGYATPKDKIYIVSNYTENSTYTGDDGKQHDFKVYKIIELIRPNGDILKDLYITAGSSYYKNCKSNNNKGEQNAWHNKY